MIKVKKDFTAPPTYLTTGGKDYNNIEIKNALNVIYNDKCCYCEQKVEYYEVEHYRPKNAVKECPSHTGYYWLRLEWSNLLRSCKICNAGTNAKHTKFPLVNEANRVPSPPTNINEYRADSTSLLAEGALLLHPEIDNPEDHLTVLPNGELEAINNSLKGLTTIKVCNLNRDTSILLKKRKKAINNIYARILMESIKANELALEFSIQEQDKGKLLRMLFTPVFKKIKQKKRKSAQFALLHRVFYAQFDYFIDTSVEIQTALTINDINDIKQTFAEYKSQNP